ncbi:MAG: response regulator [bacterium]|nr:response regulator [bacterium]
MKRCGVPILDDSLGGLSPELPTVVVGPSGSGRTVLALELLHAATSRGETAALITGEPPELLLRQAASLGLTLEHAVRTGLLTILELDARAATLVRVHGADALIEAIVEAVGSPGTFVIEEIGKLTQEILDEVSMRDVVRRLLKITAGTEGTIFVTSSNSRLRDTPALEQVLGDVAGAIVQLDRSEDGDRTLRIDKCRLGQPLAEMLPFEITAGGIRQANARQESQAKTTSLPSPPVQSDSQPDLSRPRILVAEDERFERERVQDMLGSDFDIRFAEDGFEALSALLADAPDLLILDLVMPRVTGEEVLRSLQASGSNIPVLVTSSRVGRAADRVRMLFQGATDVMTKPVNAIELKSRVTTLLAASAGGVSTLQENDVVGLLARGNSSHHLEEEAFAVLVERATEFARAYQMTSTMMAVEGEPEVIDSLVSVADETLRGDDAILALTEERVLMLLVLTPTANAQIITRRLGEALRRARIPRKGLRVGFQPVKGESENVFKDFFDDLSPWLTVEKGGK